ncbi:MAG: phage terminase large subunit [Bacteroidales bacterium]|nr:phage terminase large subunit [Candidatus Scybalousia scybalohippi]
MSLMRFLRWVHDPKFYGYVFRKNATDMKGGGGCFDEACGMMKAFDKRVTYTKQPMFLKFPNGASLSFIGMDGSQGKNAIQGKQISAAMVDEATHLTLDEVEWIISRLRTQAKEVDGSPMKPSIWLTCNPERDSFIYDWIKDYYLYPKGTVVDGELVEGRPIPERNGDYRYYLKMGSDMIWSNSEEELIKTYQHLFPLDKDGKTKCKPVKFQFIGATCRDNPPLLEADPTYEAKLLNLGRIDRERLYWGNWEAQQEDAGYFKRHWTPTESIVKLTENDPIVRRVRAWDLAATLPSESNADPDYTAGVLIAKTRSGRYIIEDVIHGRWRSGELENMLVEQVRLDRQTYGSMVDNYLPQEPASAGKLLRQVFAKLFASHGLPIKFYKVGSRNSKLDKFKPFASSAENELISCVRADWNEVYFTELERFTGSRCKFHDDLVDGTSEAYNLLATTKELPKLNAKLLVMS